MTQRPPLTDEQFDAALIAIAEPAEFSPHDLAHLRRQVLDAVDPLAPVAAVDAAEPLGSDEPLALIPRRTAARRRRRRGFAAVLVAAVLLVVGSLTVALVQAHRSTGPVPAGGRVEVTCLADPDAPTTGATELARALVTARLAVLGARGELDAPDVATGGAGRLQVAAGGIDRDRLADVCTSPRPSLRPLLTAPVGVETPPPGTVVPPAASPYPTSDTRFAMSPPEYRQEIEKALRYSDCPAATDASSSSVVVCDSVDTPTLAYLLGPAVVAPAGIADARADAPVAGGSGWTIDVTFDTDSATALGAYTAAHNAGGTAPAYTPDLCGATTMPCSDFLAIVVGGTVVSAPVIVTAITGNLQITGSYAQTDATLLAAEIAAGDLTLVAT